MERRIPSTQLEYLRRLRAEYSAAHAGVQAAEARRELAQERLRAALVRLADGTGAGGQVRIDLAVGVLTTEHEEDSNV